MGFPRFWGRVEPETVDDEDGPRKDAGSGGNRARKPSVLWTVVYYALLVVGAALWWRNLGPLTESSNALVSIDI